MKRLEVGKVYGTSNLILFLEATSTQHVMLEIKLQKLKVL